MKLKDRIKTYSFWVSLSSAIILLLRLLGQQFGFSIDEGLFSDIFTTLCGILVILGIIAPPSAKSQTTESSETTSGETEQTNLTTSDASKTNAITETVASTTETTVAESVQNLINLATPEIQSETTNENQEISENVLSETLENSLKCNGLAETSQNAETNNGSTENSQNAEASNGLTESTQNVTENSITSETATGNNVAAETLTASDVTL